MISGDSNEEIDRVEAIKKQIGATWERAKEINLQFDRCFRQMIRS